MRNELTAEQVRRMMEGFSESCPKQYAEYVQRDMILEPSRQIQLAQMSDIQFLDYVMNRNTSEHLEIYPEYAGEVMRAFSDEIFEGLRNLREVKLEDLPELRKQLGDRAKPIELSDWGELYTQVPRKNGEAMMTGKLEYKVANAVPIVGPHFFTTTTGGFYGFLKFYVEEVGKIAPKQANAYLLGTVWCVDVEEGRASSPIIAGEYRGVGLKKGIYHVVPIKFFDVELDKSRKYTTRTQVKRRDAEGNATSIVTKVVPRRK